MTAIIMNYLVCFYTFLEIYVFVYAQELRVKNHFEYYERLIQLNCMEVEDQPALSSPSSETSNIVPFVQPKQVVTVSELDAAAEGLFAELQSELGVGELTSTSDSFIDDSVDFIFETDMDFDSIDGFTTVYEFQEEESDDCIQISDLNEEDTLEPTGFEAFASAKIADDIAGPQQWVVSIVGIEESYIHISDGKRLWVNVGMERASKLTNKDVLILDVIREGNEVLVENLIRVDTQPSQEYAIPDEEHYHFNERIAI